MAWRLATFNFGPSALKTREPVSERIGRAVSVSAPLMLISEAVIYLIAVPLASFAPCDAANGGTDSLASCCSCSIRSRRSSRR